MRNNAAIVLFAAAAGLSVVGSVDAQEFQYTGDDGPAHWAELNPAWDACAGDAQTAQQSPIDIRRVTFDRNLERLELETFPTTIDLFNNGHTIEQRYEDGVSRIFFNGIWYDLKQFHFHTLSEHTVQSQHSVMELHAVFGAGDLNLVVGVLFEIGYYVNPFIQKLIDAGLPETSTDTTKTDDLINVANALTDTSAYYTYAGSLTTPPCSDTVTWVVLSKPNRVSHRQFEAFRDILGNNFRPLQAQNDRTVRSSKPPGAHGH